MRSHAGKSKELNMSFLILTNYRYYVIIPTLDLRIILICIKNN